MKLLTKDQARELDNIAIHKMGIPGVDLMGKAGAVVAEYAQKMVANIENPKIVIFCGKGNNAGDGYKAALDLNADGYTIEIINIFDRDSIKGDSKYYFDQCAIKKISISNFEDINTQKYDLIIDAILGTGFAGELRSPIVETTKWINSQNALVLAVDIPSGVNTDNGFVAEYAIQADVTVTMGYIKVGMMIQPAKSMCGEIIAADIGFPEIYSDLSGSKYRLPNEDLAFEYLKAPDLTTYKHRQGKVLVLAGSRGMTGAAILASKAAVRSGAGLVITFAPKSISNVYENNIIEGLVVACEDDGLGYFTENNFEEISNYINWTDVLLIGPGLGKNDLTIKLIEKIVREFQKPIIIDADGLRPFFGKIDQFDKINNDFVITPHFGELANLLNIDVAELKENIIDVFKQLKDFNGALVAKNAPTFILKNYEIVVNNTGNQGMATGGTGDVLAGIIASFMAQGSPASVASELGVYIHGKAADLAKDVKGLRGLIASDIIKHLPSVLKAYE